MSNMVDILWADGLFPSVSFLGIGQSCGGGTSGWQLSHHWDVLWEISPEVRCGGSAITEDSGDFRALFEESRDIVWDGVLDGGVKAPVTFALTEGVP